jgi:glutamine synthetase
MTQNYIIPAAVEYQNKLITNVKGLVDIFGEKAGKKNAKAQIEILEQVSTHVNEIRLGAQKMLEERKIANKIEDAELKAIAYCDDVKKYFDQIRYHVDKLELLVEDELWPLPKFRELLFIR